MGGGSGRHHLLSNPIRLLGARPFRKGRGARHCRHSYHFFIMRQGAYAKHAIRYTMFLPMIFSFVPKLGIDLGTTTVLVFVPKKGIVLNEPSVVAVSQGDNKILAVGNEAKEMIGRTPGDIIAYRPMKDGVIADYRVTEAILRYYIKKSLGRWNIFRPEVMISVPAGVSSTERRA